MEDRKLMRMDIFFLLKSDHKPLEFIFRKELPMVTSSSILRWAIKLMAFDFDIMYVKRNTVPYTDALSRLEFDDEKVENHENIEDKILYWLETDVLPLNLVGIETRQDSMLSKILKRINRNIWIDCSMAERPFKEMRPKITREKGIICNGDIIVSLQTLRY